MERLGVPNRLTADRKRRAELGQFMTPSNVAAFMASILKVDPPPQELWLIDAGSGTGMLTAAVVAELSARPSSRRPAAINAAAWEIDGSLHSMLHRTLEYCEEAARRSGMEFRWNIQDGDFISQAARLISGDARYDVAILNPPYRKINGESAERAALDALGMSATNLYPAFVRLTLELLRDGGEMVALTPRSFMNGTYFRTFREALLRRAAFRRVHLYDARNEVFSADGVLQENVVFHVVRSADRGPVLVTTSHGPSGGVETGRTMDPSEMVLPDDAQSVMRIVPDENGARVTRGMLSLPCQLTDLEVSISTGRVVGFRARDRLHAEAKPGDAPLISPRHCGDGFVRWPQESPKTPNGLSVSGAGDGLVLPTGWYALVNRFSAKEDRRRVVASLFDPNRVDADQVAFDNKLNVLHRGSKGLPKSLAKGLATFLNSSVVDSYFRQFSGHTQVNAGDLRALRFPDADTLARLGDAVGDVMPSTDEIDDLLANEVPEMSDSLQAAAASRAEKAPGRPPGRRRTPYRSG